MLPSPLFPHKHTHNVMTDLVVRVLSKPLPSPKKGNICSLRNYRSKRHGTVEISPSSTHTGTESVRSSPIADKHTSAFSATRMKTEQSIPGCANRTSQSPTSLCAIAVQYGVVRLSLRSALEWSSSAAYVPIWNTDANLDEHDHQPAESPDSGLRVGCTSRIWGRAITCFLFYSAPPTMLMVGAARVSSRSFSLCGAFFHSGVAS